MIDSPDIIEAEMTEFSPLKDISPEDIEATVEEVARKVRQRMSNQSALPREVLESGK